MSTQLKIFLLGSFQMEIADKIITIEDWKSKKALSIFKYFLSLNGQKVQKDVLVETFWPDHTGDQLHNLHTTIYYLRKMLKKMMATDYYNVIKYSKGLYWFNRKEIIWLDFKEFQFKYNQAISSQQQRVYQRAFALLKEVISLYRGDFLEVDLYADWSKPQRQHHQEIFIDAILRSAYLITKIKNDYLMAIQICQQGLGVDPFREEIYQTLLCYLIEAGMYTEAIKRYKEYAQILDQEFGLTPGPRLQEQLLAIKDLNQADINLFDINNKELMGAFLCNKQAFELVIELQLRRQARSGEEFSIMKLINKKQKVDLKQAIKLMQYNLRKGDVICKWDHKLVFILLQQADKKAAEIIKRRCNSLLKEHKLLEFKISYQVIKNSSQYSTLEEIV